MLRLLLTLTIATATATPPPRPDVSPRFQGFHRVYVTPDTFADALAPDQAHPDTAPDPDRVGQPPAPEGARSRVVILALAAEPLKEAGYTPDSLAEHLRTVDDVQEVRVATDGKALWVELREWRDLTEQPVPAGEATVPIANLAQVQTFPERIAPRWPVPRTTMVPIPARPPASTPHDLRIRNTVGTRAVVRIGETEIGELDPLAQGVIFDVKPGIYEVTLVDPTGFARDEAVPTVPRPAGVPDGMPARPPLPPRPARPPRR